MIFSFDCRATQSRERHTHTNYTHTNALNERMSINKTIFNHKKTELNHAKKKKLIND